MENFEESHTWKCRASLIMVAVPSMDFSHTLTYTPSSWQWKDSSKTSASFFCVSCEQRHRLVSRRFESP